MGMQIAESAGILPRKPKIGLAAGPFAKNWQLKN
jgi:hypothetical protein